METHSIHSQNGNRQDLSLVATRQPEPLLVAAEFSEAPTVLKKTLLFLPT